MTEFEPCPVTGCVPVVSWTSECSAGIEFKMCDPYLSGYELRTRWVRDGQFEDWYSRFYLPVARKYAEYLESQKPVEFQVGDEVGLNAEGFESLMFFTTRTLKNKSFIVAVADATNPLITLDKPPFSDGNTRFHRKFFRLISRPAKLTVADLPEIEGFRVFMDPPSGTWMFKVDGAPFLQSWQTEHEACQAALDFLNKIWAAKPEVV